MTREEIFKAIEATIGHVNGVIDRDDLYEELKIIDKKEHERAAIIKAKGRPRKKAIRRWVSTHEIHIAEDNEDFIRVVPVMLIGKALFTETEWCDSAEARFQLADNKKLSAYGGICDQEQYRLFGLEVDDFD